MESSPQSASSMADEYTASIPIEQEEEGEEAEQHVHMPNPSYWPILLSVAIGVALGGFVISPWISLVALVFVFIGALGLAMEDPMAPVPEEYITIVRPAEAERSRFKIGQNVVDSQGRWLGKIQARFSRYILVERGRLFPKAYYVPQRAVKDQVRNNTVFLTLSEEDLLRMGLNTVPDDLFEEAPEPAVPMVRGVAQFARRPLSPAETGHYNYGRIWPGINTDASGSYHREEIVPTPQTYVTGAPYATDKQIPPREISPD